MKPSALLVLGLAVATALAVACKRENPIDGIGSFRFGKTTLGDWGYDCQAPQNGTVFCQNNPLERSHHVSLGGQDAYVGALFGGTGKDAPLVELELHVDGCRADELRSWLIQTFGDPTTAKDGAVFWKKKLLFIAAKVPPKGIECKVNFVEADNAERVNRLQKRE